MDLENMEEIMDIRTAIVELLDKHWNLLHLTRKQVANMAEVNAGQLSNWLRTKVALSSERQGRVVRVILEQVQMVMKDKNGPAIEECVKILTEFMSRSMLQMARPDSAWRGEPIAHATPFYVGRYNDEEVRCVANVRGMRFAIIGGPQTGKTSLLIKLLNTSRSNTSVVYLDGRHFENRMTPTTNLCAWIQTQCEAQMEKALLGPAIFDGPNDFLPWLQKNILPHSTNGRCLFLFDHLEAIGHDALLMLNLIVWDHWRVIPHSYSIVFAYDLAHKHIRNLEERFADEFPRKPLVGLWERGINVLAKRVYAATIDPRVVLKKYGGHPFLTHACIAEASGKAPKGTEEQAVRTVIERIKTDWDPTFQGR